MIVELDTVRKVITIKSLSFTLNELNLFVEQHMLFDWKIEIAHEYIYYPNQPSYVYPYTPYPSTVGEHWTVTSSNGFTGTLITNGFVGTSKAIAKEQ